MKTRTAILMVLVGIMVAGAVVALAGNGPGKANPSGQPGMMGGRGPFGFHGRGFSQLDLSDEQQKKIEEIRTAGQEAMKPYREQLQALREKYRSARTEGEVDEAAIRAHVAERAKIEAEIAVIAAKTHAQVLSVLTPEQRAKLEELRASRGGEGRHGRHGEAGKGWFGHRWW